MLEILAPAGNAVCADVAINNGANAIYLGYNAFSARQSAENFDGEALRAIMERAHFCGVKVYVAMNTVVKDQELSDFLDTLVFVWGTGADAIILQDLLLGKYISKRYPEIVLHASTQAGICSVNGATFAKECGFSRVILARETPIAEIAKITKIIETEVFVQGALCTCFSGQCYFSSFVGGNSGNRGRCKQPCRKLYAYDRNGNTEKTYALSLSDLCVGEDIQKLVDAGVVSFKIEGRMRRAEYVGAAVRYYRGLLDGTGNNTLALSDLKRTYNRGNYTKGLAFGQDKRFLSTSVQGHLGEKVGVVKVMNGKYFVETRFSPLQNDAFKVLRGGVEVGGGTVEKTTGKGFYLFSKTRLKNGDGVFITTDTAVNARVLSARKTGSVSVKLTFQTGEYALAECNGVQVYSTEKLQQATGRALTKEELESCFLKTDGLPIEVSFSDVQLSKDVFVAKSVLNAFRREFYKRLSETVAKNGHKEYPLAEIPTVKLTGENKKTAIIASDFQDVAVDIAIYKPNDFQVSVPNGFKNATFEKYLYYPPFCTSADEKSFEKMLSECTFDGVFTENYAGIMFASAHGLKLFAGVGLNLLNRVSLHELLQEDNLAYYTLSKEGNEKELSCLIGEKAFVLSSGDLKLMDLCYCPFGKTCSACDRRSMYTLTDENGRAFPVRRYLDGVGACRFEVYNCAKLVGRGIKGAGQLLDCTLTQDLSQALALKDDEERQKQAYSQRTFGHFNRGVL